MPWFATAPSSDSVLQTSPRTTMPRYEVLSATVVAALLSLANASNAISLDNVTSMRPVSWDPTLSRLRGSFGGSPGISNSRVTTAQRPTP